MRRAIVVVAVGLGLAATGPSALAAHRRPLPKMATAAPFHEAPNFAVRPHTVWFTGDGTGIIGRLPKGAPAVGKTPGFLHWKTWTRKRAYAVGTLWGKNCVPDCASSRFYRHAVTITLTDPRHGHFVKMDQRLRYHGRLVDDTWCNYPGYTYWVLPPHLGGHDCPGPHAS